MYLIYPIYVAVGAVRCRPGSVLIVSSNTFYAPLIALAVRAPGTTVVHWVLDLFPEALFVTGSLKRGTWTAGFVHGVMSLTFRNADANVFIGNKLRCSANDAYGGLRRSYVIPVGADTAAFSGLFLGEECAEIGILYCGNFGRLHDVDTIIQYLCSDSLALYVKEGAFPRRIRITFAGDGVGILAIRSALRATPTRPDIAVDFVSALPSEQWISAMRSAHIGLVTMQEGAERVLFPSKTFSAMAAGQAIIAICSPHSDLADVVLEGGCGWVIQPGCGYHLGALLKEISHKPMILNTARKNAFDFVRKKYSEEAIAKSWRSMVAKLTGSQFSAMNVVV